MNNFKAKLRSSGITKTLYKDLWMIKEQVNAFYFRRKHRHELMRLSRFKDLHKGERCFIIGNGPSLQMDDLTMLKNEYSFAANAIFYAFSKTEWRPSYYGVCDIAAYERYSDEILKLNDLIRFSSLDIMQKHSEVKDFFLLGKAPYSPWRRRPQFSSKACSKVFEGGTIVYFFIQLAVYMGFKEIYLLGCDCNYNIDVSVNDGNTVDNSIKNYFFDSNAAPSSIPGTQRMFASYESAKIYAEKHGIKIFNATRGGKLEVFSRIAFDDFVFDQEEKP